MIFLGVEAVVLHGKQISKGKCPNMGGSFQDILVSVYC